MRLILDYRHERLQARQARPAHCSQPPTRSGVSPRNPSSEYGRAPRAQRPAHDLARQIAHVSGIPASCVNTGAYHDGQVEVTISQPGNLKVDGFDGSKLRQLRLNTRITQLELAKAAKLSPERISGIENGRQMPTVDTVWKLCAVLGTSPGHMLVDGPYLTAEPKML